MKLQFAAVSAGSKTITINCGSMTREFLEEYNIPYTMHYDDIKLDINAEADVDIRSFEDINHFCKKYCANITFGNGTPEIEFYSLHEEDLPLHCSWDYKDIPVQQLRAMYASFIQECSEINGSTEMNEDEKEQMKLFEETIKWVAGRKNK